VARSSVTDVDRGFKALLKRLGPKASLRVGIFGDLAAQRAIDGNGATVGDIANAHEFGLGNVPPRSWLRDTITAEAPAIKTAIERAAKAVVDGMAPERALDLLGFGVVGKIQARMSAGIPPALSPNYLPRKLAKFPGATTPLIASGQMRQSVTHAIDRGEP
jgi:hypothetical protein